MSKIDNSANNNTSTIYFGKIEKIKMLEDIFKIYFNNENADEYEKKINVLYTRKELDQLSLSSFFTNYIKKDIDKNRQCFYKYKEDNLNKCKELIEKTIEYIFGIKRVYLYIIKETDKYYTVFNSEIYAQPYYKKSLDNYKLNRTVYYNDNFDIEKEIIYNGKNKTNILEIRKNIKCSLKDGIYFTNYNPVIFILIPDKINKFYFTVEEWISVLLHEIGHVFSHILLGNVDTRLHESFADRFLSLYGYGKEFINSKRKELSTRIYLKYIGKINNIFKDNKIESLQYLNLFGLRKEYNMDISNHQCIFVRCENILNQIKYINGNIKEVKQAFYIFKNCPYYMENIDNTCKLYIKKKYIDYINNFHLDIIERMCNKIFKLNKKKFSWIMSNLLMN